MNPVTNCGQKYKNSDKWPLLYLSQTQDSHKCYVLRLTDNASSYSLLQTILYTGHQHYSNIKIINLEEKRLVKSIPINCGEPESVGQYKDGLIICGGGMCPNYYFIGYNSFIKEIGF